MEHIDPACLSSGCGVPHHNGDEEAKYGRWRSSPHFTLGKESEDG